PPAVPLASSHRLSQSHSVRQLPPLIRMFNQPMQSLEVITYDQLLKWILTFTSPSPRVFSADVDLVNRLYSKPHFYCYRMCLRRYGQSVAADSFQRLPAYGMRDGRHRCP